MEEKENDAKNHSSAASSLVDRGKRLGLGLNVWTLAILILLLGVVIIFAGNKRHVSGNDSKIAPTVKTVVATEAVGFTTDTKEDSNLLEGETTITKPGAMGKAKVTYKLYSNGRKFEVKRKVLKEPVTEEVLIGTKPRPLTDVSWDFLKVRQFNIAPMAEKLAVADRYLNENNLKGSDVPWQEPQWLVSKMQTLAKDTQGSENKRLEWEFGNRISEWKRQELSRKVSTIAQGASTDEVIAVLGEPNTTRTSERPDSATQEHFYYGPIGDPIELIFSAGRLQRIIN